MSKYRFPKIDLHLHLDGSMLPESAWEMAAERGIALPADTLEAFREFIVVTADCRSVNEYLKRFEMPLQILQDRAALERTAYELVRLLVRAKAPRWSSSTAALTTGAFMPVSRA